MKTIIVKAEVLLPKIPNFLRYGGGTLDVADIDDKALLELAQVWTDALLENAKSRRAARTQEPA